jgi:hypothetical protein
LLKDIQNNQKSIGKSIQPMDSRKKICEPKVSRFLPDVCDFQKENPIPYGMDLKIHRKSI